MQPALTETRLRASSRGVEKALRAIAAAPIGVPIAILEALLRDHLGEQAAVITACTSTPLDHQGTNDSNKFFRVTFSWALPNSALDSRTSTWIIKHWKAGGVRDSALGITQPQYWPALAGWCRCDGIGGARPIRPGIDRLGMDRCQPGSSRCRQYHPALTDHDCARQSNPGGILDE